MLKMCCFLYAGRFFYFRSIIDGEKTSGMNRRLLKRDEVEGTENKEIECIRGTPEW
jgi:hypothetical protein